MRGWGDGEPTFRIPSSPHSRISSRRRSLDESLEIPPPAARQAEPRRVVEDQRVIPTRGDADLPDPRQVHDRRPVYAREARRVESLLQRSQRLAEEMHPPPHVQLRVVVRAFHPIDFSTRYPFGWPDRAFDPIGESRSSLRS